MGILKNMFDTMFNTVDLDGYTEKEKLLVRAAKEILITHGKTKAVEALDEVIDAEFDKVDERSY